MPEPLKPETRSFYDNNEVPSLYDRSKIPVANLLTNARNQAEERKLFDIPIVDVDSHHYESSADWRALLPHFEDDQMKQWAGRHVDVGARGAVTGVTVRWQNLTGRIQRGGLDVQDEITDRSDGRDPLVVRTIWSMDQMGIDHTVLFPTALLNLGMHPQPEAEVAIARAYTNWLIKEILPQDERIKTMVYLPFNDPTAALKMVKDFAGKPGVVGFMVTAVRYCRAHDNAYMPVYAELEKRGMPLAFHAAYNWADRSMEMLNKFISVHALGFTTSNMVHLTNILMNGIPERFPRLKWLWVESGLAWIPFLMQRLDNEYMMRTSEVPALTKLPSDYMREMFFSTQPMEQVSRPGVLESTFDMMDAQNTLLWSSDYPHWDFDTPAQIFDLPFLSDHAKRRILGGNAMDLFGIKARAGQSSPAVTS